MHLILSIISFFSILIIIKSEINSEKYPSDIYLYLASVYCFIDDYSAWLEEQSILDYFLYFAQFYYIDTDRIQQKLEQYRSQRECLKVLQRLTNAIESG